MVTSNFTGDEVVLFGGDSAGCQLEARRGGYDIVINGAPAPGSHWCVRASRGCRHLGQLRICAFSTNAPAYLAVLANRPLDDIAGLETLQRLQLGLDNFPLPQRTSGGVVDSSATIRSARRLSSSRPTRGSTGKVANGVTF